MKIITIMMMMIIIIITIAAPTTTTIIGRIRIRMKKYIIPFYNIGAYLRWGTRRNYTDRTKSDN